MKFIKPIAVAQGIHHCIANAERYIKSASNLMRGDQRSAGLLLMYALEEMGKVPLISNALFYADKEDKWKRWKARFKSHEEKFWFSEEIDDFAEGKLPKQGVQKSKQLAKKKLKISYVGLSGAKFEYPENFSEAEVRKLKEICERRMDYLKKRHTSIQQDEETLINSYEVLKNMSPEDIAKLAQKIFNN